MSKRISKRQLKDNQQLLRANRILRRLGFYPVTWQSRDGSVWVESGYLGPQPFEVIGGEFDDGLRCGTKNLRREVKKAALIKRTRSVA